MTTTNEIQGQAKRMAQSITQHGAEYHAGERIEMEWQEEGRRFRGTVEITAEHLRLAAAEVERIRAR